MEQVKTRWSAETILQFLQDHRETLREMGITRIGLFGSYARGEQHTDSDIDLVFSTEKLTFRNWMGLWGWLEDQLEAQIDLIPEKDIRPELRPYIMKEVRYVQNL
jgi:uncharacterized protein